MTWSNEITREIHVIKMIVVIFFFTEEQKNNTRRIYVRFSSQQNIHLKRDIANLIFDIWSVVIFDILKKKKGKKEKGKSVVNVRNYINWISKCQTNVKELYVSEIRTASEILFIDR